MEDESFEYKNEGYTLSLWKIARCTMFQTILFCCKGHCDNIFSSSFLFRPLVLLFPAIQSVSVEISTETTQ